MSTPSAVPSPGDRPSRPVPPPPGGPPRRRSPAPAPDMRPTTGRRGERLAREHLERLGLTILAERARTRWGEIDLVAHDDRAIVFCEVKTRVARGGGVPWSSLHERKRRQVRRLAAAWLAEHPGRPTGRDVRFDAIGVVLDPDGRLVRLDHVEAAF
ncbi:YraN family protein [Patulibacter sp. SYSU D01012]|uniref:YraN family protein n=1 Tax=Patulibacter sp. SYSU D01012 TaxID=2817381 RepID=UPI001B3057E9